jgi:hypothetical protein
MVLTSILLSSGEWIFKYIHRQEDGSVAVRYQGRCISLEYVNVEFPYWKEIA